jgi:hypothetical protein
MVRDAMGLAGMDRTGSECIETERTDEDWQEWRAPKGGGG